MRSKLSGIKSKYLLVIACLSYVIPLISTLYSIFSGSIAFWYDPARDLLSGLNNLEKFTLIGPTSGIPGLFYGPYWIWMLSIGLLISHDPRIVAFIVAALPYYIVLPFVFFKLSSIVGKIPVIIGWLLFMLAFGGYSVQLWNPHPAPLLAFIVVTLLVFIPEKYQSISSKGHLLLTGFVIGLLIQFHISFGIAVTSGIFLYQIALFTIQLLMQKGKKQVVLRHLVLNFFIVVGVCVSALPFFVFEIRHGFNQVHTILATLSTPHAVVGVVGISDHEIVTKFIERFVRLLSLPMGLSILIGLVTVSIYSINIYKNKFSFNAQELRLISLTMIVGMAILLVYLVSRNPVWDYHFIGVEVIFIFLIMIMITKSRMLVYLYSGIIFYLVAMSLFNLYNEISSDPKKLSSLATKEHIVSTIFSDAQNDKFTIVAYNPAIYTYDYDYLTRWYSERFNKHLPEKNAEDVNIVYLIIPPSTAPAITQDFINYKTPSSIFETEKKWNITNGSIILKRVKSLR